MDIYKEIADGFINAEIAIIDGLILQDPQPFVMDVCNKVKSYLTIERNNIADDIDLITIKKKLRTISEIIDIFIMALPNESSWWVMPLVKECYERCNLRFEQRKVLIIHSQDSSYYGVIPDITSYISDIVNDNNVKIDVFIIPLVAGYDVSSISILGHEVGHIAFKENMNAINRTVDEELYQIFGAPSLFDHGSEKYNQRRRVASYITEYVCDNIGYELFGAAFIYALLKEFCPYIYQPKNNTDSHPSEVSRFFNSHSKLKDCSLAAERFGNGLNTCLQNILNNINPLIDKMTLLSRYRSNKDNCFHETLSSTL
ncbi:MAG: hypothetical protein L7F77_06940 [Candidatus Magnetominusculus sp. LBB02]|nr:hypothetical protein [Candidatus Magnetominusculus sp. LBB02]